MSRNGNSESSYINLLSGDIHRVNCAKDISVCSTTIAAAATCMNTGKRVPHVCTCIIVPVEQYYIHEDALVVPSTTSSRYHPLTLIPKLEVGFDGSVRGIITSRIIDEALG